MMGQFPLEQWFYEMPVCTRWWMTAALSASVLVQCTVVSPYQLFYSYRSVFIKSQVPYLPRLRTPTPASLLTKLLCLVLASCNHLFLLWPAEFRSAIPHLLPSAVLAPRRRIVRPFPRPLLVASCLCVYTSPLHSAHIVHGIPRLCSFKHPDLYLESQESRCHAQFPGSARLQGTVPPVGAFVLFARLVRNRAQGRHVWHCSGAQYAALHSLTPYSFANHVIVWYFFNDVYPPLHNGHKPLDPPAWWIRMFEGTPPPEEPVEDEDSINQPVDPVQN